jgi:hypothetical protein
MATGTRTFATLELSQSAYDEIERKLLDAGYGHFFNDGPGSPINMTDVWVTRESISSDGRQTIHFKDDVSITLPPGMRGRAKLPEGYKLTENKPRPRFCFECGENVVGPCERKDCLESVSQRTAGDEAAA